MKERTLSWPWVWRFHVLNSATRPQARSAGFQACRIADFLVGAGRRVRGVCGFGNPRYSRLGSLRYEVGYGSPARAAFTRWELLAVLAALALLGCTVLPLLAGNRRIADRLVCASNLQRVGQGWHSWMTEHREQFPWWTPVQEGGLYHSPLVANAYASFLCLSNYSDSASFLVCPADTATRLMASDWPTFASGPFRGNALSYCIGTDANMSGPLALLSSDRHLVGIYEEYCSVGARAFAVHRANPRVGWAMPEIHFDAGNLLQADGAVQQLSSAGLRAHLLSRNGDYNGNNHTLLPR